MRKLSLDWSLDKMAENTDVQEIPQDSKKENLETSKDFIENVLQSLKQA